MARPTARSIFLGATGVLLLVAVLVGFRWERLALAALDPGAPFDAQVVPTAPDYADLAAWTAHAAQDDASDAVPRGVQAVDPAHAPVDVFYLHPTSFLGSGWNGPVDAEVNALTDELATRIQASAFNGCCAIYGPRYRQAHGYAFLRPGAESDAALEIAYGDVRRAFQYFLEEISRGRPFILAAHSQGSVLGARLLREEIAGGGLSERLVTAYLIGAPIAAEPFPGAPPCARPEETGCLVTWNARGPRFPGSVFDFRSEGEWICVNPLTWRHDEAPGDAALNRGAVFLHAGDGSVLPHFADGRCQHGVLVVSAIGRPPRDLRSRVLDWMMGPENYHPIEYQLFYMNIRENAEARVAAYLRGRSDAIPTTADPPDGS